MLGCLARQLYIAGMQFPHVMCTCRSEPAGTCMCPLCSLLPPSHVAPSLALADANLVNTVSSASATDERYETVLVVL